ncbi:MAG: U32 family peptidase [Prevotellaceae bacterium]|jgi:putative protease|nr:U32 family peptidase [Prevotellaceae bacterium]
MAPAGNFECLAAAAQGGADAVYFGVGNLNMRARAAHNFSPGDLARITDFCRRRHLRSYLTVNTVLYDDELDEMRRLIDAARQAGVTAIIASDIAAIECARRQGVEVHLSTQCNLTNIEAVRFYARFADVMVLSRELTLDKIKHIHSQIIATPVNGPGGKPVRIELFCHGALCMATSGKCYLSLHEHNASANRGACYQVCRRGYTVTDNESGRQLAIDNQYIMSPKDLCTIGFLDKLLDAGVRVFKIEGRARAADYVQTVTACYRRAIDACLAGNYTPRLTEQLTATLRTVFNRGFWDGYYQGAALGEWSEAYGNKATERKTYIGKATNYFNRLGVAEFLIETGELEAGDDILIIGPTTGVVRKTVTEIRVALQAVPKTVKGETCSIAIPEKIRRADKLYKIAYS